MSYCALLKQSLFHIYVRIKILLYNYFVRKPIILDMLDHQTFIRVNFIKFGAVNYENRVFVEKMVDSRSLQFATVIFFK